MLNERSPAKKSTGLAAARLRHLRRLLLNPSRVPFWRRGAVERGSLCNRIRHSCHLLLARGGIKLEGGPSFPRIRHFSLLIC